MASSTAYAKRTIRDVPGTPPNYADYPLLRYMGSKHRLLEWIDESSLDLKFNSALDAFSGSGAVSYLLKTRRKRVISNDFLHFSHILSKATIENSHQQLNLDDVQSVIAPARNFPKFIQRTFKDIFFTADDLEFLDLASHNLKGLRNPHKRALALASLIRACVKKQPRGVFTITSNTDKYNDGRRDLRLSIKEHFLEQVALFNSIVFDNGKLNRSFNCDVFNPLLKSSKPDLVYMDPPYVPRADDNCYMKRYHFLEGLSLYWEGCEIMPSSKVKKIKKPYTPFSYKRTAIEAFENMFRTFADSILVLSYSSNGFPDLKILSKMMKKYKKTVVVHKREHRYHFGTHANVNRSVVNEYLIIGT